MKRTSGPYILPCGCKIFTRKYANGEQGAIDRCLLHEAAPDLLEALRDLKKRADRARSILHKDENSQWLMLETSEAQAIIDKIKKEV